MYYTYVIRPGEGIEGRGPQFQPFWNALMNNNLRGGFLLQLIGYLLILLSGVLGGNFLSVFYVIDSQLSAMKDSPVPLVFLGSVCLTIGGLWIQNFRSITDDDASIRESRGFRVGTKFLQHASLMDLISWSFTAISLFSLMHYFDDTWSLKHSASGTNALFGLVSRSLHALSCALYSSALFFLECFHSEGTNDAWGWFLGAIYFFTGCFEFLMLLNFAFLNPLWNVLFTLSFGIALVGSFAWASHFEPLLMNAGVKLTQSAMRIESYKSKRAIAYYGPAMTSEI